MHLLQLFMCRLDGRRNFIQDYQRMFAHVFKLRRYSTFFLSFMNLHQYFLHQYCSFAMNNKFFISKEDHYIPEKNYCKKNILQKQLNFKRLWSKQFHSNFETYVAPRKPGLQSQVPLMWLQEAPFSHLQVFKQSFPYVLFWHGIPQSDPVQPRVYE